MSPAAYSFRSGTSVTFSCSTPRPGALLPPATQRRSSVWLRRPASSSTVAVRRYAPPSAGREGAAHRILARRDRCIRPRARSSPSIRRPPAPSRAARLAGRARAPAPPRRRGRSRSRRRASGSPFWTKTRSLRSPTYKSAGWTSRWADAGPGLPVHVRDGGLGGEARRPRRIRAVEVDAQAVATRASVRPLVLEGTLAAAALDPRLPPGPGGPNDEVVPVRRREERGSGLDPVAHLGARQGHRPRSSSRPRPRSRARPRRTGRRSRGPPSPRTRAGGTPAPRRRGRSGRPDALRGPRG